MTQVAYENTSEVILEGLTPLNRYLYLNPFIVCVTNTVFKTKSLHEELTQY